MLGFDAHFWEQLMLGSLAVVGVFGVAVALFTAAVVITQRRENAEAKHEFETYKLGVSENIALSNERLVKAETDGEFAKQQAAIANKAAAEANERANVAALELEKYRAPRVLNKEQLDRIGDKIRPFSKTRFVVGIVQGSRESADFATQLEDAIISAGWEQQGWAGSMIMLERVARPMVGSVTVSGVVVQIHPDDVVALEKAALTLANSLYDEGIKVVASQSPNGITHLNKGDVHLLVGPKQ